MERVKKRVKRNKKHDELCPLFLRFSHPLRTRGRLETAAWRRLIGARALLSDGSSFETRESGDTVLMPPAIVTRSAGNPGVWLTFYWNITNNGGAQLEGDVTNSSRGTIRRAANDEFPLPPSSSLLLFSVSFFFFLFLSYFRSSLFSPLSFFFIVETLKRRGAITKYFHPELSGNFTREKVSLSLENFDATIKAEGKHSVNRTLAN